jgi:hypothetical protein
MHKLQSNCDILVVWYFYSIRKCSFFYIFPWDSLEVLRIASDNRTFVSFWAFMQGLPVIYKIYGLVDLFLLLVATFCLSTEVKPILIKIECLRTVRLGMICTLLMKVRRNSFLMQFHFY